MSARSGDRERPGDDAEGWLGDLIAARDDGRINETELHFLLMMLFPAGYDTSKNALTLTMSVLLDRPDLYEKCAADLGYCKKVIDESFRYLTTSTIPRLVTREFEYRDVLIALVHVAGTRLPREAAPRMEVPRVVPDDPRTAFEREPDRDGADGRGGRGRPEFPDELLRNVRVRRHGFTVPR